MKMLTTHDFLLTCYRALLGREPDALGFDQYIQYLNTTNDYTKILKSFIDSAEFHNKWFEIKEDESLIGETYYFFHIPKTAGMYFKKFLTMNVGSENVFPGYFVKDLLNNCYKLKKYRFFSGHFLGNLDTILGKTTRKATLLRNPIDRAVSHYFHYQRDSSLPLYNKLAGRSIKEILLKKEISGFLRNYQSKYLATLIEEENLFSHAIEIRHFEDYHDDKMLLDKALQALDLIECVGVQSDLLSFIKNLAALWNIPSGRTVDRVNTGLNRDDSIISKEEFDLLYEANLVDISLYKIATDRINHLPEKNKIDMMHS